MKGLNKLLYLIIVLLFILIMVTLYAKMNLYVTISFNSNGGNKIEEKKVKRGDKLGKLPIPIKKDYTFMYWTIGNKEVNENYIIKEDIILIALYEKNKEEEKTIEPSMKLYTIKYDTNGGSKIGDYTVVEGEKAKEPESPVKEGYEFKEWTLDGKPYNFNMEVTSDITLTATYTKDEIETYTVTFDTDGGNKIEDKIVEKNTIVAKPTDPKKKGYTFKEWTLDGKLYNFNTTVTSDITLKAIYEKNSEVKISEYTITFDTDGGSLIQNQVVKENEVVTKPVNPEKSGYEFKEWQLNNETYNFDTKVTSNITLKAMYTKLDEVTENGLVNN